jgi:hypothetical protein
MLDQFSNIAAEAANDSSFGSQSRERTVPIPQSITPVPGYPRKLVVFKIRASRFWQVRCWLNGKTHRKSTQSQSLRVAQSFARRYYELLLVNHLRQVDSIVVIENSKVEIKEVKTQLTFAAMTAQMFANEQARVERGEFSRLSLQVLHNRFDLHILPRWGNWSVKKIDYKELLNFVQFLSKTLSSITVRQYLVGIRKVLKHAVAVGALDVLPEFPKVKIVTTPRGAFTPSEYWKIIRCARRLQNTEHPDSKKLLRKNFRLRYAEKTMPKDVAWAIGFMVNSFIRPSDLKTLKHRHVEVVKGKNTYLRLNLPETKSHSMLYEFMNS